MMVDHIVPISMGGFAAPFNLVAACGSCNAKKRRRVWIPENFDEICTNHVWRCHVLEQASKKPTLYHEALEYNVTARLTKTQYDFLTSLDLNIPDAIRWLIDEAISEEMTVAECAKMLNMHPSTIRKAIKRGDIEAIKFGRQWAVLRESAEDFRDNPPRMGRPPKDDERDTRRPPE